MKLRTYLVNKLNKALAHQDEHMCSGSAKAVVKEAEFNLKLYDLKVAEYMDEPDFPADMAWPFPTRSKP